MLRVGREREPVVIIDHATGAAESLIDAASRSGFEPASAVGSHYPGLLGPVPRAYVDAMVRFVLPFIEAHFDLGKIAPARARGNFSLVTTPPADLEPEQRMPHIDAADRLQFATVHFLCDEDHGGTGFFRHRATGFETIDRQRLDAYNGALSRETADDRAGYQHSTDSRFERIAACEARFDRMLLYRAALLHSGLIEKIPDHAADPRRGRLTGNLFLQCAVRR
ncbi:DUF6445 family protein [Hephaestia mangrovi]|uniref:DUF6445 family protein n=1 Tax=Hephaestia mangrovi TaxID=2873268 RepID=UPI001CA7B23F